MEAFDLVFTFADVKASYTSQSQKPATKPMVLVNVLGTAGDSSNAELLRGQLGIVHRPRAANATGSARLICALGSDHVYPLCGQDLRINARYPNPKEGDTALAHDAGGFVALTDNGDKVAAGPRAGMPKGTTLIAYAPRLDDAGAVVKAHSFTLDSSVAGDAISLVHGLGHGLILTKDGKVVLKNRTGTAFLGIDDDGPFIGGSFKFTSGAVFGDIPAAQPVALAPSILSYLAALEAWAVQVDVAIASLVAALPPPGPANNAAAMAARIAAATGVSTSFTTKVSASP